MGGADWSWWDRRTWPLLPARNEEGYLGPGAFPDGQEAARRSAKDGDPFALVAEASGLNFSRIGPSATPGSLALKLWVGSTRFCCGQPLRSSLPPPPAQ